MTRHAHQGLQLLLQILDPFGLLDHKALEVLQTFFDALSYESPPKSALVSWGAQGCARSSSLGVVARL